MQDETREYPENDPGQAETGGEMVSAMHYEA
jgi:hypothetical protein